MNNDTQSRKYQLTINNPIKNGEYTHERINEILQSEFKSVVYYCMADELGLEEETPHTHLYVAFSGGVRFSTIKKHFPTSHIEKARGTSAENRDYIQKSGKWESDDKRGTQVSGTFEEWGDMPKENRGTVVEAMIIERILDGGTNAEILCEFPHYLRGLRDIEYVRQTLKAEEYRDKWRELETIYIWGSTGVGKTRSVMDGHGYSNVYAVNNYKHPFDGYAGEKVMLFDEFNSGFRIQDMNNYLDGYPISLPARYSNKQACYEKVFIVSNLDLREQYKSEQQTVPEVWAAFIRRIHKVIKFMPNGSRSEYKTQDYLNRNDEWVELPKDFPTPWSETK